MIPDPIVEQSREVREKLIAEHGGFDGWVEHLQSIDAARLKKPQRKPMGEILPKQKKPRRGDRSRAAQ